MGRLYKTSLTAISCAGDRYWPALPEGLDGAASYSAACARFLHLQLLAPRRRQWWLTNPSRSPVFSRYATAMNQGSDHRG